MCPLRPRRIQQHATLNAPCGRRVADTTDVTFDGPPTSWREAVERLEHVVIEGQRAAQATTTATTEKPSPPAASEGGRLHESAYILRVDLVLKMPLPMPTPSDPAATVRVPFDLFASEHEAGGCSRSNADTILWVPSSTHNLFASSHSLVDSTVMRALTLAAASTTVSVVATRAT